MSTQIEGGETSKSIKNPPSTLEGPSGVPWRAQGHQNGAREWQNDSQGAQNGGKKNAPNRNNKKTKHLKQHGGGVWRQQMDKLTSSNMTCHFFRPRFLKQVPALLKVM